MSDKLSSPSTSSGHSSGYSPRSRASVGNGDEPRLVIRRQPPTYLYSNESFDVELALELPKTASPPTLGSNEIEFVASLHHAKSGRECGIEAILITEPSRIMVLPSNEISKRTCKVKCMIRMDVIRRDQGATLELRFGPRYDVAPGAARNIPIVSTNPIHLVNYKIRLSMEEEWGQIWFKDEGGRDKSMEVFAAIYDKDGQLRTGEQIPLHPTLCYDTEGAKPVKVTNQEILRTLGASKIVIDKDNGKARVRFRVEDVSKNHQGQDFVLEVGTDPKTKAFKDVAPAYTPSVNVRSKRNKRSRKEAMQPGRSAGEKRGSPLTSSRRPYDDQQEVTFDGVDIARLREAMKGVLHWTDEVVNGLYPLQWQVLGYAQLPDGSPDYNRPYHNMPDPNPCIGRILSMYSESVRENLRLLLEAVEKAGPPHPEPPEYTMPPAAASMPRGGDDPYGLLRSPPPPQMHAQATMPPNVIRRAGMHPSVASEAFRDKPSEFSFQARGTLPTMQHVPLSSPYLQNRPSGMLVDDRDMARMHGQVPQTRQPVPAHASLPDVPTQRSLRDHTGMDQERESEVAYVLAKQYKALRTGERLGFPAYSANKELLGFYRETNNKLGVGQFTPISRHQNDFGPLEIMQATEILDDAIAKKSEAVFALKDWGSIAHMLDRIWVYEWSKGIGDEPPAPPTTG